MPLIVYVNLLMLAVPGKIYISDHLLFVYLFRYIPFHSQWIVHVTQWIQLMVTVLFMSWIGWWQQFLAACKWSLPVCFFSIVLFFKWGPPKCLLESRGIRWRLQLLVRCRWSLTFLILCLFMDTELFLFVPVLFFVNSGTPNYLCESADDGSSWQNVSDHFLFAPVLYLH